MDCRLRKGTPIVMTGRIVEIFPDRFVRLELDNNDILDCWPVYKGKRMPAVSLKSFGKTWRRAGKKGNG